jgi:hypothetical protein
MKKVERGRMKIAFKVKDTLKVGKMESQSLQYPEQILRKLEIEPSFNNFQIFISSLNTILQYSDGASIESLKTWDAPVLPNLKGLSLDEVSLIESELAKPAISIEESQIQVQKLIDQFQRKKFAAYYTIDQGTRFMAAITDEYLKNLGKEKLVCVDPFLGSARTLTAAVQKIGVEKIAKVWGVEPLTLPALVAYAALLKATRGRRDLITVIVGDAFEEISKISPLFLHSQLPKADMILTNPPFTRWESLGKTYRAYLLDVVAGLGYKKYLTRKSVNLQALSMFLSDYVLNNNGLLVSVLPASSFYTIYGKGYKSLLREKYSVLSVLECASRPSFSEDSGFKEVIITAIKTSITMRQTVFAELNKDAEGIAKAIMEGNKLDKMNYFDIHTLPRFLDINWLALFGENKLRRVVVDVFEQGLKAGTLGYWNDVLGRKSIVRGIEMYGPDFFFIPNKYWQVQKDEKDLVEIENVESKAKLSLSKKFLVRTLRKPSLYNYVIAASVDSYMLTVPPVEFDVLPRDLQQYIEWGIGAGVAKPAIGAHGKYWYSHVYKQVTVKKPFGHVFIPDKVDLVFKRRGVFANYSEEEVAASKNFYIVKEPGIAKLLVGWFNSTIFTSILILLGRKISETWTRFLENDYLELPMINVNAVNGEAASKVCETVDKILNHRLPPFWTQMEEEYRRLLDLHLAQALKLEKPENVVEELHKVLLNHRFNNQSRQT